MTDRDDDVRGLAMAAFYEHESSVTPAETEAALAAVRERIDAGERGVAFIAPIAAPAEARRPVWMLLGSAAAAVVLVVGGLAVLSREGSAPQQVGVSDTDLQPASSSGAAPAVTAPVTTIPVVASTNPAPTLEPGEFALPDNCLTDFNCTQLASTEDGRIVAYDPTTDELSIWDAEGREVQIETALAEPIAEASPFLVHVGPDDVAYVSRQSGDDFDGARDLLAIPLVGAIAGTVVMSWDGLDGTGDSSLIAQRAGLVSIGCCGPREVRPAVDSSIFRFVDRNGVILQSDEPRFRLDLGDAGNNLVRIDGPFDDDEAESTFFSLPSLLQNPRDVPRLAATDDGGALALDYPQEVQASVIVDFDTDWEDFGIDNGDVYLIDQIGDDQGPVLLERGGTVVIRDGAGFVRRTLDEIGTPGWPGRVVTTIDDGATTAPGLNEYVTENQPSWAADLRLFAYQIDQSVGPGEQLSVAVDEATGTITLTTTGIQDDSTAASQRIVQTERADDGLLRFVSGTYGWSCQPGRGHQDFSTEPCI